MHSIYPYCFYCEVISNLYTAMCLRRLFRVQITLTDSYTRFEAATEQQCDDEQIFLN